MSTSSVFEWREINGLFGVHFLPGWAGWPVHNPLVDGDFPSPAQCSKTKIHFYVISIFLELSLKPAVFLRIKVHLF